LPGKQEKVDGLWRSANYAFAPNFYQYCGPDKNKELSGYIRFKAADNGLKKMLLHFSAMHPDLKLIAHENSITDEFDNRVVEAYWLGNKLLNKVSLDCFYQHIKLRLPKKEMKWFEMKLPAGAKPNHQFHVLNFVIRTGHRQVQHTVETMDNCRISSGVIIDLADKFKKNLSCLRQVVKTDRLVYRQGKLKLVPAVKAFKNLVNDYKAGDLVTLHWGWICEKITPTQAKNLEFYTRLALRLANKTI